MPISLKINHKAVPGTHGTLHQWYATTLSHGCTTIDEAVARIQAMCTVHEADVRAVVTAFREQCLEIMKSGCGVSLGPLGTIYPRVKSVLADSPADCTPEMVERLEPRWVAPKRLMKQLNSELKPSFRIESFGAEHTAPSTPPATGA